MRKQLGVLALSISATAVAYANPSPHSSDTSRWTQTQVGWTQSELQAHDHDGWFDQFGDKFQDWFHTTWGQDSHHGRYGTVAAPEFDPASALAALTFLSGGLAVLRGRRSKRQ